MTAVVEGASATPSARPADANADRLVAGRFRLLEPLGRGGMGRVYRAHDELLNRPVAVKLIYDDAIEDRDIRHACALEARAAARLNHPGIVRILDSGFDDGHLYVVMSLAEGTTLAELLRTERQLAVSRALQIGIQVADALSTAHREGVVHCDVKPGNLVVRPDGRVQLVDFGIARISASTTGLDASTLQGSAEYVAPEQVEGTAVDGRTDLYTLGVVLYEMLAGRTPFGGGTVSAVLARRLVGPPPSVRAARPPVPLEVERIVQRALQRDPDRRFQTAAELRDALKAAHTPAPPPPVTARPAGSTTATMPVPRLSARPQHTDLHRLGSTMSRSTGRFKVGATTLAGVAAVWILAALRSGRAFFMRTGSMLSGSRAPMRLRTQSVRLSLRTGLVMAVMLGLLVGVFAARCSPFGASTESALASESSRSAAPPEPTSPPPATRAAPTATPPPPPTATPSPTAPPPAQMFSVPAVAAPPAARPPDEDDNDHQPEKPDDKKPQPARKVEAPKPEAKRPEPKKSEGGSGPGRGSGDNRGNGPQKRR